jgi:predicted nucleic-acid-binding Zn-ribbon protein
MRKLPYVIYLFLLASFSLYLSACTAGSCFDETEARVKATFYSNETGKALAPDTITLFGINMDTLYNKAPKLKSAEFPLYAADTTCKFIIMINGITDTLEFNYSSYTYLISKECGYTFFFSLDTTIHSSNTIDTITIEKKTITTFNEENMRIFY